MAKIAPVADVASFLSCLEKSGLLSADQLAEAKTRSQSVGDPKVLARDLVKANHLTKWQAGQLLHGFTQLTLGKHRLLDQLSSSETGRVYLAEHAQLGRKAALKVLPKKLTSQPAVLKAFLEESRRIAALEHRNISHLYDVAADEDRYFLVLEHVEGKDLRQLVEETGATSPAQALDFVRQMAAALAYAHGQQMIHGGLRPTSVLIDAQGSVKIQDFGLNRLAGGAANLSLEESAENQLAGVGFIAPEQAGSSEAPKPAGDVYSLGALLVYLLTGKAPGVTNTPEKLAEKVPGISPEVVKLASRLLATKPQDRPETVGEVARAIAELSAAPMAIAEPVEEVLEVLAVEEVVEVPQISVTPKKAEKSGAKPASSSSMSFSAEGILANDAADDPIGPIVLSTKKKAVKKPGAATPASPASASGATPPKPKKKGAGASSNLPLILAGAIGGGVLLLGGLAFGIYMMMGGSSKPTKTVAQAATTPNTTTPANKEATVAKTPAKEATEANPVVSEESDPVMPAEQPTPPAAAAATGNPPVGEKPATPKATDPAAPATTPTPDMPPAPAPAPSPAPTTEPAAPAPMPMPAAPTPPPAAPMPMVDPLANFTKTAISLPKLDGKAEDPLPAPIELGPLTFNPKVDVVAYLLGGEGAATGKQVFSISEGTNGSLTKRDWELHVNPDVNSQSGPVIATLSIKDDKLMFAWTEEAKKQPNSANLSNCILNLNAGKAQKKIALREATVLPGLSLKTDKPLKELKWTIENAPDPKRVIVEVVGIDGMPAKQFDPKAQLDAAKDSTIVKVGNSDQELLLHYKLDVVMKGKSLTITPKMLLKIGEQTEATPYNKKAVMDLAKTLDQQKILLEGQLKVADELTKKNKERGDQMKRQVEANQKARDAAAKHEPVLQELLKRADENGRIQFRVYYKIDNDRVDLVTTGG